MDIVFLTRLSVILTLQVDFWHVAVQEGEVYILPTIRINTGQYRGKLSYYEVLRAICAGFNKHNEPAACNRVGEDDCRIGAAGQRDCASR